MGLRHFEVGSSSKLKVVFGIFCKEILCYFPPPKKKAGISVNTEQVCVFFFMLSVYKDTVLFSKQLLFIVRDNPQFAIQNLLFQLTLFLLPPGLVTHLWKNHNSFFGTWPIDWEPLIQHIFVKFCSRFAFSWTHGEFSLYRYNAT